MLRRLTKLSKRKLRLKIRPEKLKLVRWNSSKVENEIEDDEENFENEENSGRFGNWLIYSGFFISAMIGAYIGQNYYIENYLIKTEPAESGKSELINSKKKENSQIKNEENKKNSQSEVVKEEKKEVNIVDEEELKAIVQKPAFNEIFLQEEKLFKMEELKTGIDTKLEDLTQDHVIFLVPPKDDREFLLQLKGQLSGVVKLYNVANSSNSSELKVQYILMKSKREMETLGENIKQKLEIDGNVPLFIMKNKFMTDAAVITLKDLYNDPDKLFLQFKPLSTLHQNNHQKFADYLEDLDESSLLIFQYHDPNGEGFKETQSNFYKMNTNGWFSSRSHSELFFVKDKSFFKNLKVELQNGDFMLLKKTQTGKGNLEIGDNSFNAIIWGPDDTSNLEEDEVIESLGELYYKNNTFVHRDLPIKNCDFSVELRVDLNQIKDIQVKAIESVMASARELMEQKTINNSVKFYFIPRSFSSSEGNLITLIMRDNTKNEIRHEYFFENKSLEKSKIILEKNPEFGKGDQTYEYSFPENQEMTPENIANWIKDTTEGKIPQYYKTEIKPDYVRFSRSLSGTNFEETIIKNPINHVMMVYSKHCASCKRFTPVYEKLARENIEEAGLALGQPTMFNRIDSDLNDIKKYKNFSNTPVFAVYRNEFKERPFIYKGNVMTEKLMKDFFKVSLEFKVMKEEICNALVEKIQGISSFDEIKI